MKFTSPKIVRKATTRRYGRGSGPPRAAIAAARSWCVRGRSRTNTISPTLIAAGMNAMKKSGRISWPSAKYSASPISGPTTAPNVSAARWNPNARPRSACGVSSAISASRGAPRIPLPVRSATRATSTSGQAYASPIKSFETEDSV